MPSSEKANASTSLPRACALTRGFFKRGSYWLMTRRNSSSMSARHPRRQAPGDVGQIGNAEQRVERNAALPRIEQAQQVAADRAHQGFRLGLVRSVDATFPVGNPLQKTALSHGLSPVLGSGSRPELGEREPALRLFLVELADQRQGERSAHVLEVRAHFEVDAIPAGIALDVGHGDFRLTQRTAAAHTFGRVVHIGDVLPDPDVEFLLEVAALFPGADVLAFE